VKTFQQFKLPTKKKHRPGNITKIKLVERRKKKNRKICEDMFHQDGKMKSRTQDSN